MTTKNKNIRLWTRTFDNSRWKNQDKIDELLTLITSMEAVIARYLSQIKHDFPNLTDHSMIHSDMLWKYADIIIGDKKDYLNPLEGFILSAVFILHDSGMCCSVLNNALSIKEDPIYKDYIVNNSTVLPKDELEYEALFYTVRQNHGEYAMRIAKEPLANGDYFINNTSYREEFSDFIGKIAKSHTCNINYIEREFGSTYASPNFPTEWTIDCQKLAYILRVADAAHLDNLRTPKSIKIICEMTGNSKELWSFQKKLGFPTIKNDNLLTYVSNQPFTLNEQKAWWFCINALRLLDAELKDAKNYFILKEQIGFEAEGVKGIDDTLTIGKQFIKTEGWDSIDTTIKVTNPVFIASELGGIKLYGNPNIAIRELIQNSIDAINLYRVFTKQNHTAVGKIKVELTKNDDKFILTITDNGIGMTTNLMTKELLDFGGSYWKSNKFYNEFKGLVDQGFKSIGKFGIGFFSVFMLGHKITVTSWKYGENIDSMKTLDFYDGLFSSPLLRPPSPLEKNRIIDRGTSVSIELDSNPFEQNGILHRESFKEPSVFSLVKYYTPGVNVEIETKEVDGKSNTLPPNAIESMNYLSMFEYFDLKKNDGFVNGIPVSTVVDFVKKLPLNLVDIKSGDKNTLYGRLILIPDTNNTVISCASAILANGIRVKELQGMAGYINTDDVISIKRDVSKKVISFNSIEEWAKQQLEQINNGNMRDLYDKKYNDLLITFNLFDENFPLIVTKKENYYTFHPITYFREHLKKNDKISFYREGFSMLARQPSCPGFIEYTLGLNLNEIIVNEDIEKLLSSDKVIKKILAEEWGDFEEEFENLLLKPIPFTPLDRLPYVTIRKFKKK